MKERPILFSAPMVRAILEGRKTQTRRPVKHPLAVAAKRILSYKNQSEFACILSDDSGGIIHCPHGKPGDRLWVRESFDFLPDGGPDEPDACTIVYWATGSTESRVAPSDYNPKIYGHEKVRPSIHMPRWASRITLKITSVKVERLQDISEKDAGAEGCYAGQYEYHHNAEGTETAKDSFQCLWESINGRGSWDASPWVWVVSFERVAF